MKALESVRKTFQQEADRIRMENKLFIARVCTLAGKIMLKSGAETYRVEDTMNRIASAFGLKNAQSYVTPTGINFSTGFADPTNTIRVTERSTDLQKIAEVNSISRKIDEGDLDAIEAFRLLKAIEKADFTFPDWMQIIMATLVSGCFTIMFGGVWQDFLPACIAGGAGYAVTIGTNHFLNIRLLSDFTGSFAIGILAILFIQTGLGAEMDKIIIGAVMPLVPGLHITNAVRDLMAGHLLSGMAKGAEAILTAFAIGTGIAVVLSFL